MATNPILDHTFLVVDDDKIVRKMIVRMLLNNGATEVRQAENGAFAVKEIGDMERCDYVLLDKEMDGVGGVEFLRVLRGGATGGYKETPVIMITAHTDEETVKAAKAHGVDHFIAKPVTVEKLKDRLKAVQAHPRVPEWRKKREEKNKSEAV